ncbi:MAG: OmpA family protein [Cytophagales bacterium]|nr:OmpA family protein [Cytophagales bacterium]
MGLTTVAQAQTDVALVELADEVFNSGAPKDALELYQQAALINEKNVKAQFMIGRCYLKSTTEKAKSVTYFHEANKLDPTISTRILYFIAEGYRFGYEFEKAKQYYSQYLDMLEGDESCCPGENIPKRIRKTKKKIIECDNAQQYVNSPVNAIITNLGAINSEFDDYAPTLSADGKTMYLTSRRGVSGDLKDVDNLYYENIYVSKLVNGKWTKPEKMGETINHKDAHGSTIGLSPDGNLLYIYTIEGNGNINISKRKKGEWKRPKPFSEINTQHQETTVFETSDGSKLFFSSNKPGGNGRLDIYMCTKVKKNKWSDPKPLSDVINTDYDEEGAVFDVNTNTLYFSSRGHNSMGGYDVFRSVYNSQNDTWSKPVNLGYPVNSSDDDLFFILSSDGQLAYYASFKDDSKGGLDLYSVKLIEDYGDGVSTPEEPEQPIDLSVFITDDKTGGPVNATIELIKLDQLGKETVIENLTFTGDSIRKTFTPDMKGEYILKIKAEDEEGYFESTLDIEADPTTKRQQLTEVVRLTSKVKKVVDPDPTPDPNPNTDPTPTSVKTRPVSLVISVVDQTTGEILDAEVQILEKNKTTPLLKQKTTNGHFEYQFNDKELTEYVVIVSADKHVFKTLEIKVDPSETGATRIEKIVALRIPKADPNHKKPQRLKNLYFDFNLFTLKPASFPELNALAKVMEQNPTMQIEIAGHTDDIGTHLYNHNLSFKRATAVKNYLVKKGVRTSRVKVIAYGETKPMASNDDEEEGRELNRRTEFVILKK